MLKFCLKYYLIFPLIISLVIFGKLSYFIDKPSEAAASKIEKKSDNPAVEYLDFFEKVFKTMEENYYQPISRESFDRFIEKFNSKIYPQLKLSGKSNDYIRWRSAAFLIEALRSSEDIFSAFYPPEPAKKYEETSLGQRIDLGIEGKVVAEGFTATFVEPRSDAYTKGFREEDIILAINGQSILGKEQKYVEELLNPLDKSIVQLTYRATRHNNELTIDVVSQEYFKQSVFSITTGARGIYGLEIQHFNRKTSEDVLRFMQYFEEQGPIKGLIIDLRGNPGGPPLAARELSSFFLPGGEDFAYFQRKDDVKSGLDIPVIPSKFKYDGPIVILINKGSGSASELFSGVMQKRNRAILMGQNSAGQVMLKSMFHFDDESMALLVTARGHHPDGSVFSFGGLNPDRVVGAGEEDKLINYATEYLMYVNIKGIPLKAQHG